MENRNNDRYPPDWLVLLLLAIGIWGLLLCLEWAGAAGMGWKVALSGGLWVPALILALYLIVNALMLLADKIVRLCRLRRRRKAVDSQIRTHAQAFGVWDRPEYMGGRGLELSAWEHYKIRRRPGETDASLRLRCRHEKSKQQERSTKE